MGGEITLESKEGEGSTFYFTINLAYGETENTSPDNGKLISLCEEAHNERVLLVEDNPINQKVALMNLKKMGYSCDVANNGQEAIDFIREKGERFYTFVLMDMQMPVLDGVSATKEIRRLWPDGNIRIIALTANAFDSDKKTCILSNPC